MDTKDSDRKGKTLGPRGGTETSHVRQSFSHGRSKSVTVEHKRKRVVVPKPGAAAPGAGQSARNTMGQNLSDAEFERRLKAVEAAKAQEAERQAKEREAAEAREAELGRLRAEKDAAERAAREREIAEQRAAAAAEEAAAAESSAVAKAKPAARTPDAAPVDPAAAQAQAARAEAGRPVAQKKTGDRAPVEDKRTRLKGEDDRRRSGKLTIARATNEEGRQRSLAATRRRQERDKRRMMGAGGEREKIVRDVQVPDAITVQELANRMAERVAAVVKTLMQNGIMATQNQTIDADTAALIVEEFGHKVVRVSESDVEDVIVQASEEDRSNLEPRPPVVTIMGHVDHGKTSLLDAIRKTNVVSGEAGGITQHIGAYQVATEGGAKITFLDTPGHAAFTSMRARGAQVTDIVVLVVAADDSVMPQTIEAISHAKAAGVPMIVAINKIDKPGADPNKVRTQLLSHEIVVEGMGGEVLDVEVSAVTGKGLDTLLENIALQAELLDLKANPDRLAEGAVIEAKLDVGRGPVATVLVQKGTLRRGDIFVVGEQWGKVRALINDQGERVEEAAPSVPVEVLGLNGTPEAGDVLNVVDNESKAREIASYRERLSRDKRATLGSATTLDQLLAKAKADKDLRELPVVVKSDVQGSAEAIVQALEKLGTDEVRVRVLHSGVGAITESDVGLAEASNAPIIGFNVRANAPARESANQKGVEIRYYSIIYDLVDDVKAAASGLLSPEIREKFIGYAEILQVFKVSGVGKVAGCKVNEGVARRSAGVRLLRDNVVIHEGKLKTLKRFKDEVREVQAGQECGMAFEHYEDIREGDVIEIFETETVERQLA
ncbi:MAG TPA: translation initiation factor IF-2 [Amaricoccus sp.]|uniref:translation initiation factor IF-2 n=1 Tax=Amaricoccus sp. TaxID=1872485 RepID=UPI002BA86508|nr:translation initiation factor IF-2 [Amaricoccus sp.]HMQ92646.1 translation initiation factor IF-2 [Amaricoccus sp.]HMR52893.1 translation initiation factor IF-2 [Amaricoccus sp.]HMR59249.1 translation initiation factor IF-2 [Amaricoccus sp.]HMT97743.1 translation initiation factor IF-2 [Amaricoccus sp.]